VSLDLLGAAWLDPDSGGAVDGSNRWDDDCGGGLDGGDSDDGALRDG